VYSSIMQRPQSAKTRKLAPRELHRSSFTGAPSRSRFAQCDCPAVRRPKLSRDLSRWREGFTSATAVPPTLERDTIAASHGL